MDRPDASSASEKLLRLTEQQLVPGADVHKNIKQRISRRIEQTIFQEAREALTPQPATARTIWERIRQGIAAPNAVPLFERMRDLLNPSSALSASVWQRVRTRFSSPVIVPVVSRPIQWVALAAVFLVAARLSPLLFLPHTIAESEVFLLPVAGQVFVSALHEGETLLQPVTAQVSIEKQALIRTGDDGAATLLIHDDAVLRLAVSTTLQIRDLSDRPDPATTVSTAVLLSGRLCVQSFIPSAFDGFSLALDQAAVTVHEGSVCVKQADDASHWRIFVLDRHAAVRVGTRTVDLLAGQWVEIGMNTLSAARHMTADQFADPWLSENMKMNAVHQKEVAQLQQERRAAEAGILPTNKLLYPVKRMAETVDVLFTLNPEQRAQKKLAQANVRFNEAAALLKDGGQQEAAAGSLKEYQAAMLEVASGSGGDALVNSLVNEQVAQATADVSAALPGDQSYALKQVVLQTSAELPNSEVDAADVNSTLLFDQLAALRHQVEEGGDLSQAKENFIAFQANFSSLSAAESALPEDVRKETEASLQNLALTLGEPVSAPTALEPQTDVLNPELVPPSLVLSDEQMDALITRMLGRINLYRQTRSQVNQLFLELHAVQGRADEGRILRRLLRALPADGTDLRHFVNLAMDHLEHQVQREESGSGTASQ